MIAPFSLGQIPGLIKLNGKWAHGAGQLAVLHSQFNHDEGLTLEFGLPGAHKRLGAIAGALDENEPGLSLPATLRIMRLDLEYLRCSVRRERPYPLADDLRPPVSFQAPGGNQAVALPVRFGFELGGPVLFTPLDTIGGRNPFGNGQGEERKGNRFLNV